MPVSDNRTTMDPAETDRQKNPARTVGADDRGRIDRSAVFVVTDVFSGVISRSLTGRPGIRALSVV